MEDNNELSTRNEDINSKRTELLNELYAFKESLTGINNPNLTNNPNMNTNTDTSTTKDNAYTLTNGHSLLPKDGNNFGNLNNGFVNALILGIIVFFTETLFLLIGYLLFK